MQHFEKNQNVKIQHEHTQILNNFKYCIKILFMLLSLLTPLKFCTQNKSFI